MLASRRFLGQHFLRCFRKNGRYDCHRQLNTQKMTETNFCLNYYDVIGLDLDHTLARYHLRPLLQLIARSVIRYMVEEKSYPHNLCQSIENCTDFFLKGLVLDKVKGNFLKLSSNNVILQATHGTTPLTDKEIVAIYGVDRVWASSLTLPEAMCQPSFSHQLIFVFRDYFTLPVPFILARAIDLVDKNKGESWAKPYALVWEDVLEGIRHMYHRDSFHKNEGAFFPSIRENPSLYFAKCEDSLLAWLKEVRRKKKLFLLTSSNIDYAVILLNYCVGPDWKDYFDLVLTFARKPGFFNNTRPFLQVKAEAETNKLASLSWGGIFSQGNWMDLKNFLAKECKSFEPKVLYIGDSLVEDVLCPAGYTSCHCIAIVEEMAAEGMVGHPADHPSIAELTSRHWGSFFCTAEGVESLMSKIIRTRAKIAVPFLSTLAQITFKKSVPCFSDTNIHAGYYPSMPLPFNIKT